MCVRVAGALQALYAQICVYICVYMCVWGRAPVAGGGRSPGASIPPSIPVMSRPLLQLPAEQRRAGSGASPTLPGHRVPLAAAPRARQRKAAVPSHLAHTFGMSVPGLSLGAARLFPVRRDETKGWAEIKLNIV